MTPMKRNSFSELEHLLLSKENALGLNVPEYSLELAKDSGKSGWMYQSKKNLRPEEALTCFLEDHGYTVMGEEGRLIKMVHSLMCLVAHEEHQNGSMTRTSKSGNRTILLRPCFAMSPTAEFTKEHFRSIISEASIDSIIEYLEDFGDLLRRKDTIGFDPDELDLIYGFIEAVGTQKLLNIFEAASNEGSFFGGWPDIVAIRDSIAHLVEVKTTDSITKKQKDWICTFKNILDIPYSIIRLKKMNQI
ncbi:hypothetical protein [Microbulbifer sp. MCCC 1A16149]|uniref:hypothetical protein n=1 Tax=Microbulbifer sp. MCCC 1A16149 TaxID=3411322 RepID=UPI003D0C99F2